MPSAKTERLVVRVTPEDRELLQRAADADLLDLTTYIRRAALQAAMRWAAANASGSAERPKES